MSMLLIIINAKGNKPNQGIKPLAKLLVKKRKEMFYLTTHPAHFLFTV